MGKGAGDSALHTSAASAHGAEASRLRVGDCQVEADLDRIVAPHGETALEPKAMAVLMHLVARAGEVVSTGELIDAVWYGRPMGDNPVYRCIAQLRRALGDDPRSPRYIATVPTKGYRLIADVVPAEPEATREAPSAMVPEPAPATVPAREGRAVRWSAALLVAGLVLAGVWWAGSRPSPRSPLGADADASVAVLPMQGAAQGDAGGRVAGTVTDLVRVALGRVPGLVVVADGSTYAAATATASPRAIAQRLHVRYLVQGSTTVTGQGIQVDVRLLDTRSGQVAWQGRETQPSTALAALRDGLVRDLLRALGKAPVSRDPAMERAVHPEAYAVYLQARERMRRADPPSAAAAVELYRRATILDPDFAAAYLGLAQALMRAADADPGPATAMRDEGRRALERARTLDPRSGVVLGELARLAADPSQAEELYRQGLSLSPNDGDGYVHYAQWLFMHGRVGEALAEIERARRIEPLAPELCLTQAFFVMVVRSDVAEHDRLVEQALAINPRLPEALYQLAYSKWEYSGHFAEAAQLVERALAAQPGWPVARALARDIYLDLGDPAAAEAALGNAPPPAATLELAQYRGDATAVAAAVSGISPAQWPDHGPQAAAAQGVRDVALARGDTAWALRLLQPVDAAHAAHVPMWYRGFDVVYADVLVLAGHRQEGLARARQVLDLVDAHGQGRVPHWFSRERSGAFAVLGDDARALDALEHSVANGQVYRWWYLAGHDPLYARLRDTPRFRALDRLVRRHRDEQRALLAGMRRAPPSRG
ncbi:MAG: hypothetical protein B7X39_18805 [Lysobacterales bacterium 14-68-21]|jgi:DNA-binding winged helix-turn-helix (wHTH) protein/TolB-like protein/Tfp pilus assembly protein PilF|nr:MAG: hypothetical protein B7X45_14770 [Xanthomonadales bacterium 15-68-25]OZB63582.1 MAG: hypothetical protein B7X39_18805 [Xanthomonadales bacterium 14-68-21]